MSFEPKVWGDTLCRLQKEIADFAYATWIAPLAVKTAKDQIVLGCPSSFHRDRVRIQLLWESVHDRENLLERVPDVH